MDQCLSRNSPTAIMTQIRHWYSAWDLVTTKSSYLLHAIRFKQISPTLKMEEQVLPKCYLTSYHPTQSQPKRPKNSFVTSHNSIPVTLTSHSIVFFFLARTLNQFPSLKQDSLHDMEAVMHFHPFNRQWNHRLICRNSWLRGWRDSNIQREMFHFNNTVTC